MRDRYARRTHYILDSKSNVVVPRKVDSKLNVLGRSCIHDILWPTREITRRHLRRGSQLSRNGAGVA
jgi:hypothetical protein